LLHALAAEHRLIRYDERGNGLSDWNVNDISFEAFVRDLETVVDAARLDRFSLLGVSQGCPVSIVYALSNPGRVSHLVAWLGPGESSIPSVPNLSRVAVLTDVTDPFKDRLIKAYQASGERLGLSIWPVLIKTPEDIEPEFSKIAQWVPMGLLSGQADCYSFSVRVLGRPLSTTKFR
jgi:pimeloyl-ACP methyl ester carboxylesterase